MFAVINFGIILVRMGVKALNTNEVTQQGRSEMVSDKASVSGNSGQHKHLRGDWKNSQRLVESDQKCRRKSRDQIAS